MQILSYLFWPNPYAPDYSNPKVVLLLLVCGVLVVGSFALKRWRKNKKNAVTKKLSRSWPSAAFWFGLIGLFLVVSRVEGISYVSMRVWWLVWFVTMGIYVGIQIKMYSMRNYEVLPKEQSADDPREKYLPKKKKRL